jgi:hypothetical protein
MTNSSRRISETAASFPVLWDHQETIELIHL